MFNQISDVVAEHVNGGDDGCSELWKINWDCLAGPSRALTWIECKLLRAGAFQCVIIAFRKRMLELFDAIYQKLQRFRFKS